jgi:hypothetical protein
MKKLFGLVILSFLICTSSFAKQSIKNILNIGASKKEVCKALGFSAQVDHIEKHNSQLCHAGSNPKKNFAYSYKYQTEVISTGFKVWYVFENVTVPIKCGIIAFCKKGNGTLKGVFTIVDYDTEFEAKQAAYKAANIPLKIVSKSVSNTTTNNVSNNFNSSNTADIAVLIQRAKNTCKELGFKEGTEKFTDCSLKLYSQSLDLAAKQNQQVVIQNQGTSSDTIKVFDVVRDRENTMRKAKGLIDGSCTLANYIFC